MKKILILFTVSLLGSMANAGTVIVTNTNNSGAGSLRAQIALASNGDTITFSSTIANGRNDTIFLNSELTIRKSLTIIGKLNSTDTLFLNGQNTHQIMDVNLTGLSNENFYIQNLGFINGSNPSSAGGAIYARCDSITIENSFFSNNRARQGGAVYFYGDFSGLTSKKHAKFKSVKFMNNSALSHSGGGLASFSGDDNSTIIEECEFKFNTSINEGGAIWAMGEDLILTIKNSIINSNTASDNGGGISMESSFRSSLLKIDSSTIEGNSSQENGGAIYSLNKSSGTYIELNHTSVSNNSSSEDGGAIYNEFSPSSSGTSAKIKSIHSKINNNSASESGGGIYNISTDSSIIIMENTEMKNNSSNSFYFGGGAIYTTGINYVNVKHSDFNNNSSYKGGAFYIVGITYNHSEAHFYNSRISNNSSFSDGGGIYFASFSSPQLYVNSCEMDSNISNNGKGGAVFLKTNSSSGLAYMEGINSTFSRNEANYGGAIYNYSTRGPFISGGHFDFKNITVAENSANTEGGGVYIKINTSSSFRELAFTIENSTFYNNIKGSIFTTINNGTEFSSIDIKGSLIHSNDSLNLVVDSLVSGGYNSFQDSLISGSLPTDLLNTKDNQLELDSLKFNGGFGKTMMPKTTSILYNSGNSSDISDAQNWVIKGVREIGACENVNLIQVYDTIYACRGYLSPSGNYWTNSGDYIDKITLPTSDTLFQINLTVKPNTTQYLDYPYLIANDTGAQYQWLDCGNGFSVISGAIGRRFTIATNGSYAVEVKKNGCTDTTNCININNVGIGEDDFISGNNLSVYPNPFTNEITISLDKEILKGVVEIIDLNGKILYSNSFRNQKLIKIELNDFSSGIYFIQIKTASKLLTSKIIKQ